MGTSFSTTTADCQKVKFVKVEDGRLQVYVRNLPQKAKRCIALSSSYPLLAIPSIDQSPPVPRSTRPARPDVLVTRTSKAMSSTELLCAGEVANALSPRVPLCANPRLPVVLNNRNLCETFNQLLKNVLDVVCWV